MEDPVHDTRGPYYQSSPSDRLLHSNTQQSRTTVGTGGSTRRVWLVSILAAVGFLAVSTGTAKFYYAKGQATALASIARQQQVANLGVTADDHKGEDTNPHDTYICTGETTLPVLQGVDLVAYHSLEPDSPAVYGSGHHDIMFNGYTFWFSSEENKELFAVGTAWL